MVYGQLLLVFELQQLQIISKYKKCFKHFKIDTRHQISINFEQLYMLIGQVEYNILMMILDKVLKIEQ